MPSPAMSTDFMFVNYDIGERGQFLEPPLRSTKSAYVAKQYHRKVRLRRAEAWKEQLQMGTICPNGSNQARKRNPAPKQFQSKANMVWTETNNDDEREEVDLFEDARKPMTILGEGRLDPFSALPAENVPTFVHELLDHSIMYYWTGLAPPDPGETVGSIHKAWMQMCRGSPTLFYSAIVAAHQHYSFLHKSPAASKSTDLMLLSYKTQAIKHVNEQLNSLDKEIPDELLAAVELLAWNGPHLGVGPPPKVQSPLATAQWLCFKGNMAPQLEHVNALILLVSMKGGLDKITTLGIPEVLAFSDILYATWFLRAPAWPELNPPEPLVVSGKHKLDPIATDLSSVLGKSFGPLHKVWLCSDIIKAFQTMCDVTIALDHYHRGGPTSPTLPDLVMIRNSCQHQLLCLPDHSAPQATPAFCMYEVCRLAALIYSNLVIFPLPTKCGVGDKLVSRLRKALFAVFATFPEDNHHVLLWAVTLGGIQCSSSSDRRWFVQQFADLSERFALVQWGRIVDSLTSFVWSDFVLEKEGVELWLEARELKHGDKKTILEQVVEMRQTMHKSGMAVLGHMPVHLKKASDGTLVMS